MYAVDETSLSVLGLFGCAKSAVLGFFVANIGTGGRLISARF